MVKDLSELRQRFEAGRKTTGVDLGPPWGTITMAQLSAKSTMELLKIWKQAGLVKIVKTPDGKQQVSVTIDESDLNLDAAYDAFLETTIRAAINDDGRQLFVGKEGRELAEQIPLEGLGKLTSAVMEMAGTEQEGN